MRANILGLLAVSMALVAPFLSLAEDVDIVGIVSGCGDGLVESGESCDGVNLNSQSCITTGFTGGTLSCTASCTLNTTACTTSGGSSSSGGGGGGGRGTSLFSLFRSTIALKGYASPFSEVLVIVDGKKAASTTADSAGLYSVSLRNQGEGTYRFGVRQTSVSGQRSGNFGFSLAVPRRGTVKVDDLFLAPVLFVDKRTVMQGGEVKVAGITMPGATVTVALQALGATVYLASTTAEASGSYLMRLDTDPFALGEYALSTYASWGEHTSASSRTRLDVGVENIFNSSTTWCAEKADLNGDCVVDMKDFSILMFWYKKDVSDTFATVATDQLSNDRTIDLVDFSIMLSEWSGAR